MTDKMTVAVALQRILWAIEDARRWAIQNNIASKENVYCKDKTALSVLRAAVEENAALKAEVAEQENARSILTELCLREKARAEKAEAELTAARPLLEAVEKLEWVKSRDGKTLTATNADMLLRSALALKERK